MCIKKLKNSYQKNGIVLALGAGVAMCAGLPDWRELLKRIGADFLGPDGSTLIDKLIADGYSLPSIASILKSFSSKEDNFSNIVRNELYRDFPFFPEGVNEQNSHSFINLIRQNKNQTLNAVASLCSIRVSENPNLFIRNPRIKSIINFNVDTVLREYFQVGFPQLDSRPDKTKPIVRSIERASKSSRNDRTNIYYMHGNLRFDSKARRPDKEADDLVFTEQEYFDFFNSPTSLFNYTFLYLLREYSFLFIGLSMKDDNIRRLLHYSKMERVQAIIAEGDKSDEKIETEVLRHYTILKGNKKDQKNRLIEISLNKLGSSVIWIDDFNDIPKILGEVYTCNGNAWTKVYSTK